MPCFLLIHRKDSWTSSAIIVLFFSGVQLLVLGIIGEYVGRVFEEVKNRPLFIEAERAGWGGPPRIMKPEYANAYDTFEQRHWWFRARRNILRRFLHREVGWKEGMEVLEVVLAPGLNLYTLYPSGLKLCGLDPDPINSERARQRGPWPVYTGTLEQLPPEVRERTFDVICSFDVLEHIEHDEPALAILKKRLKPDGHLVLSVPAYQWMWGRQDVVNMHYRRYTQHDLVTRLSRNGFRVQRSTIFNTLLFPLIAAARILARLRPATNGDRSDFSFGPPWLDRMLFAIFNSEACLVDHINLPFGVSVLAS